MSNNYMTEKYMTSILQQYQQNSPAKSGSQDVSNNLNQFLENEEKSRRQLNESLFKSIDNSFVQHINKMSVDMTRMTETPLRVQQNVRNPVITSDSFCRQKSFDEPNVGQMRPLSVKSISSQYLGPTIPQTRIRAQTYKAKVIDYSNGIIEKVGPNLKSFSNPSVLSERNIGPMPTITPNRSGQSVKTLQSISQTFPQIPPKPILKSSGSSSAQNLNRLKTGDNSLLINKSLDYNHKTVPKSNNISPFKSKTIERDSLVIGYENQGIIRSIDLDKNEAFYCFYCNTYMKKLMKVEKHCKIDFHKRNIITTLENSLNNRLNKQFIFGQISPNETLESIGLKAETIFRMELDRISPQNKHYYYVKGIRLKNPGGTDAYYCRFCEQSIQNLTEIEIHLSAETHRQNENQITFSKLLSQTTEPIIGLHFITEYMSTDSVKPIYECNLCNLFEDAFDMYLHICSFKHRLNLLKKFNPNEVILNTIKESPHAIKEIKKRITDLSHSITTGTIIKVKNKPNFKKLVQQKSKQSDIEVIDITDDDIGIPSNLKNNLSIGLSTDEEAADAALVIQALKESVVKYYLNKIPAHMRRVLINKVMDVQEVMDLI